MDADNYIDQEIGNYRLAEKLDCGSFRCVYPNSATAYENKGFALMNLKRYEAALVALDQAIGFDPNSAIAYDNKGWILSALKRNVEAKQAYEKALQLG